MPRKNTSTKRGPGRPRKPPYDLQAEIEKANAGIRRTARRQLGLDKMDLEEFFDDANRLTGKHKFTRHEMHRFRRMLDELYRNFVTDKQEVEAKLNAEYVDLLRSEAINHDLAKGTKMMDRADWNREHGLRSDGKGLKPGPKARPKKMVWQLEPGEKGTATEKPEPVDIEVMEKEVMDQAAADYAKQKKERPANTVGKRLRQTEANPLRKSAPGNFWI